jgi:hypothetical protein
MGDFGKKVDFWVRKYPLFLRFFGKPPQNLGGIFWGEGGSRTSSNPKPDPPNFAIFLKFSRIFGKFWDFSERGGFRDRSTPDRKKWSNSTWAPEANPLNLIISGLGADPPQIGVRPPQIGVRPPPGGVRPPPRRGQTPPRRGPDPPNQGLPPRENPISALISRFQL